LLKPEDLSHIRILSSPIITLNGDRIYFTVTRINPEKDMYETNIWVYDLGSRKVYGLTSGPNDYSPEPSPNGKLLAFLSRRGFAEKELGTAIYMVDTEGSAEPWILVRFKNKVSSIAWRPDGKELAAIISEGKLEEDVKHIEDLPVWINGIGYAYYLSSNLYLIDPLSGEYHKITEGKHFVRQMAWSRNGRFIAYTVSEDRFHPYLTDLHIYDLETNEDILILKDITSYSPIVWSPDNRYVSLIYHRRERGFATHHKVYVVDIETREKICITCDFDRNAYNTLNSDVRISSNAKNIYWTKEGYLYYMLCDRGLTKLYRVKLGSELELLIDKEGFIIDEFSVSDNDIVALLGMTPHEPRELYVLRGKDLVKLTNMNQFYLSRIKPGKVEKFTFRSSDGKTIDAWTMYLQDLKQGEKIPWILYIHGGPKTAYGWSFVEEFHFLVNNGYAIVYGNPRGSDGYDEEFADIRGHYGERDYQDLMEIVNEALKHYDFLDPDRVGVAGGSYGGFMTNWIITHTDRFKVAVTQRSICDWISMYGTTDIGHYFVEDQIKCVPWRTPDVCLEKSPKMYVENVKTPTLIIHSEQDYRCWLDQALMLFKALKLRKVLVRLVIFPGENHDLSRSGKPKHRFERLKEIKGWFDKYLKCKKEKSN